MLFSNSIGSSIFGLLLGALLEWFDSKVGVTGLTLKQWYTPKKYFDQAETEKVKLEAIKPLFLLSRASMCKYQDFHLYIASSRLIHYKQKEIRQDVAMSAWTAVIYAIVAGIFTTLEATINAKLGRIVTPKIATMHSLITGVVVILLINLIKGSLNQYAKIFYVHPVWLIGGVFGTFIIYLVTKTIPILGVSTTLTIVISSQIISSLLIDAFLFKHVLLYWQKIAGVIFLLLGTYLITQYK